MEYEQEEKLNASDPAAPSVEEILSQVASQVGDTFFGDM
jgi:hypothetical protein